MVSSVGRFVVWGNRLWLCCLLQRRLFRSVMGRVGVLGRAKDAIGMPREMVPTRRRPFGDGRAITKWSCKHRKETLKTRVGWENRGCSSRLKQDPLVFRNPGCSLRSFGWSTNHKMLRKLRLKARDFHFASTWLVQWLRLKPQSQLRRPTAAHARDFPAPIN